MSRAAGVVAAATDRSTWSGTSGCSTPYWLLPDVEPFGIVLPPLRHKQAPLQRDRRGVADRVQHTATWQLACLPSAPQYWGATATDIRQAVAPRPLVPPRHRGEHIRHESR